MLDFDIKGFIDRYFEEHDQEFMDGLDEAIGETEDPVEISALADWVFRNYMAEAFSAALRENNERLLEEVEKMIERASQKSGARDRKLLEIQEGLLPRTPSGRLPELPKNLREKLDLDIDLSMD